jgi:hypothetical protein
LTKIILVVKIRSWARSSLLIFRLEPEPSRARLDSITIGYTVFWNWLYSILELVILQLAIPELANLEFTILEWTILELVIPELAIFWNWLFQSFDCRCRCSRVDDEGMCDKWHSKINCFKNRFLGVSPVWPQDGADRKNAPSDYHFPLFLNWKDESAKSAGQVCRPSLPAKSAGQVCRPSLPAKSASQARSVNIEMSNPISGS